MIQVVGLPGAAQASVRIMYTDAVKKLTFFLLLPILILALAACSSGAGQAADELGIVYRSPT